MTRAILGFLVCGLLGGTACAQTLNIASSAPVTSIDPHYHTLSPNESLDSHIYERLVDRDAQWAHDRRSGVTPGTCATIAPGNSSCGPRRFTTARRSPPKMSPTRWPACRA